jgi:hypothetical protein
MQKLRVPMSLRRALGAACGSLLILNSASGSAAPAETNLPAPASLLVVAPYLQNLSPTGVTFVWRSDKPSYGFVEFGPTDQLGQKAETVRDGLKEANVQWHKVRLTGLQPGTRYHYRVVDRAIAAFGPYKTTFAPDTATPIRSFVTPPATADKLHCIILNDLHNSVRLARKLTDAVPNRTWDLALLNGDIFADVNNETNAWPLINGFVDACDGRERQIVFIRGNHETRGAFARLLRQGVEYPGDQFYFAMTRGPVRFVVLDCGEDKPDSHWAYSGLNDFEGYRRDELEWLKRETASTEFRTAQYRVLVHHTPLYGHTNDPAAIASFRAAWQPTIQAAGFDLALNAHTHHRQLEAVGEFGNPFPVMIGGGPDEKSGVAIVLDADATRLKVQALDVSGAVVMEQECRPRTSRAPR